MVAIALAAILCMGSVVQVSAGEVLVGEKETENGICSELSLDGKMYFKSQEYDDIYEDGNQHVMVASKEENSTELVAIPMKRSDIKFNDKDAVEAFLKREDLPKEAIESFKEKYQAYLALEGETEIQPALTLFEPATTATTRNGGDPDYITTYTYNGWPMQTYHFNYTNNSTGWKNVKKGKTTKDTVKLIYDIALSVGSEVNKKLSYFSTGKSILDAFLNYNGLSSNQVTTNVGDYFQARLVWDQSEKYTMTDRGGLTSWQTGLITYKITVKQLGQETYFVNSGKGPYLTDRTYKEVVKSEHYDNPWATAFKNGDMAVREYVSWSTGGVSYDFS